MRELWSHVRPQRVHEAVTQLRHITATALLLVERGHFGITDIIIALDCFFFKGEESLQSALNNHTEIHF